MFINRKGIATYVKLSSFVSMSFLFLLQPPNSATSASASVGRKSSNDVLMENDARLDSAMIDLEAASCPIDGSDPMQQEASGSPEGEAQHGNDNNNNSDDDIESLREMFKDMVCLV